MPTRSSDACRHRDLSPLFPPSPLRPVRLLAMAAAWVAYGLAQQAAAQFCEVDWTADYFAPAGTDNIVHSAHAWDDGSGPRLFIGGKFVAAGGAAARHIARWDGANWSNMDEGFNGWVYAIEHFDGGDGGSLYVGGWFDRAGAPTTRYIARWDGRHWRPVRSGVNATVRALETFDDGSGEALYVGGGMTDASGVPVSGVARWDGETWMAVGAAPLRSVYALAVHDDGSGPALYATGTFDFERDGQRFRHIARWDGVAWSPVGQGLSDRSSALATIDHGDGPMLYATQSGDEPGQPAVEAISRWDGHAWTTLPGGPSRGVQALRAFDDGTGEQLYASGWFKQLDGQPGGGVARFDGDSWELVGGGLTGHMDDTSIYRAEAMTVWPGADGRDRLVVVGDFSRAGGAAAANVALWDGARWSAPATPGPGAPDSIVISLETLDDGNGRALYAGGWFSSVGTTVARGIARFDGQRWSALAGDGGGQPGTGEGVDSIVGAVAMHDDGRGRALFVGGGFEHAGGLRTGPIARFDGARWSAVGKPPAGGVNALLSFDDGAGPALYAGGRFPATPTRIDHGVVRWDGHAWSDVGKGLIYPVIALVAHDDGSGPAIYAAAQDSTGVPGRPRGPWRWDGREWLPVGGGLRGDIRGMVVHDDGGGPMLYVSGSFFEAGVMYGHGVARWDGHAWTDISEGAGLDGRSVLAEIDTGDGPRLAAVTRFDQIALWDGATWTRTSSTTDGSILALAAFDDGKGGVGPGGAGQALFAGGHMRVAAGAASAFMARLACNPVPCEADLTGDGVLDAFDFLEFQNLFEAGDPRADFNGDGRLDLFDYGAYLVAFDAGCPTG